MIHNRYILIIFFFLFLIQSVFPDEPRDRAIAVDVEIIEEPEMKAVFSWEFDDKAIRYIIRKKIIHEEKWDTLAILPKNQTRFTDAEFHDSTHYDYGIVKEKENYSSYSFFAAGTNIRLRSYNGAVLLLVDETIAPYLEKELARYEKDLTAEGWAVIRHDVPRAEDFDTLRIGYVKNIIEYEYHNTPSLRSIVLFGRVPVPYSGAYAIDGHIPDHHGAWPADVYYASPNAIWTDELVNAYSASRKQNHNIPEDGKFDETTVNGEVSYELGRIDMFDLPAFEESEIELLRNYLDKNHRFRHGKINTEQKALIDDRLQFNYVEPFSAGAWNNFYALFGEENIITGAYRDHLEHNSYLWSYGSNSGSFTSVAHVAYARDFAQLPANSIFTSFTGSWLADWDSENNLLRAAIASSPSMLASFFDGLPDWHYHNMALGETIGYATKLTQNNKDLFKANDIDGFRQIHIALMGDPTLRMKYPQPPANFYIRDTVIHKNEEMAVLSFETVPGADGYNIYTKIRNSQKYYYLDFTESNDYYYPLEKLNIYDLKIKTVIHENVRTGSYYNESIGIFLRDDTLSGISKNGHDLDLQIYPNPCREHLYIRFNGKNIEISTLAIYDINGNIIKEFIPENNSHSIYWDLKDQDNNKVQPGIYVIQLSAGVRVHVAKVSVMY